VFVGRAAETAAAEQGWAAVRSGARELIFIGGEPGAGKSRLAEEIAAALHRRGAVVLIGTCSAEPGPGYQPFVTCLEQLLGGTDEGVLADHLGGSAGELLRLTPLVRRHRPDLPTPPGDGSDYRRELFDAVTDLLRSVSQDRPVVCVLEDLHWAGTPTLQLLSHVTQHSAQSRLLLLCTHRTTAPDRSDELTYAIADLYRLEGVRRIDLPGLSADEVAQYLVAEGGLPERRAREYAAVLRDQTGGNPFFLREMWRDIASRGAAAPVRPSVTAAPASIRDTLQRRLARLVLREREVLETAAVLGDGGAVRILVAACGGDPGEALSALDTAARFGLVDAEELTRGRVAFPHMLTRQAVLDLVNPSRRAVLHARVGDVLQSAGDVGSPGVVRQLAYHFAQASALGYGGKAAEYLARSAREAERSLAFEDAAAWYAQAAELGEGPESEHEELRFAAARSHVRAGDFAGARTLYLRLGDSRDPSVRLRAAVGYEDAAFRPGLPGADACALLSRALEDVPGDPGDPWYVRALASLGRAMAFTGDDRARPVAEQALEYARRLGDKRLLSHAVLAMMWQPVAPGSPGDWLALAAELAPLAREIEDWEALGISAIWRAVTAYAQTDPDAWSDAVADGDLATRSSGQPLLAYLSGANGYARAFLRGDFAEAERIAEHLLEVGRSFGSDGTEGPYGLQMYMIRRETGALEAVRPLVEAARQAQPTWEPGLLALYTELGLTGQARSLLRRLLESPDVSPGRQVWWGQWSAVLVFLVEAAVALGDADAARRLRPLLVPFSGGQLVAGDFVALFGPADAYLAALDSVLGDDESAERLFERALDQNRALGSTVHRAAILTAWAGHLRSRGDLSRRYEDMRDEARRLAASSGQVRLMRLLDAPTADSAGLTAREIDVLRLISRGRSNRDIATELRISENTAANHVKSILIKTGAANRTQVAMIAVSRRWIDDHGPESAP
jgi:DNA-binding CsgD family transcriptional regulator